MSFLQCRITPLINQELFERIQDEINHSKKSSSKQVIAGEYQRRPFCILSFDHHESSLNLKKYINLPLFANVKHNQKDNDNNTGTTISMTDLGESIASQILSRCALVRSVSELWAMAPTIQDCAAQVQAWTRETAVGRETFQRLANDENNKNASWKLTVHTLGTKYTVPEHNEMRSHFSQAILNQLGGPVKLQDCDYEYILVRECALDPRGGVVYPRFDNHGQLIPEHDAQPALAWYFGRVLGGRRQVKGRGQIETYSLKKRAYLGPTSMDTELSLIMTNLAHVQTGSVVMDPFVGTGSILLSCAIRGAYCVGTDIDIRVLRGKGADQTVFANFAQYGLPRPELVRSDNALYDRHYRTDHPLYDAIVTDPPYGIRAGARRTGSRHDQFREIPDEERHDHIAQTKPYAVSDVMADLLDMAARTLVMGGRLVYIIPSLQDFDAESDLPRHPCLSLVHICYQPLSFELGRRMVAMEKIYEYKVEDRKEYMEYVWKNGPESAEKCANLREKITEAAKLKPNYEERSAARKQKRKEHKETRKRFKEERQQQQEGPKNG